MFLQLYLFLISTRIFKAQFFHSVSNRKCICKPINLKCCSVCGIEKPYFTYQIMHWIGKIAIKIGRSDNFTRKSNSHARKGIFANQNPQQILLKIQRNAIHDNQEKWYYSLITSSSYLPECLRLMTLYQISTCMINDIYSLHLRK